MRMVRERLPDDGLHGGTRTRHEITAQDVTRRVGIAATVAPAEDDERPPARRIRGISPTSSHTPRTRRRASPAHQGPRSSLSIHRQAPEESRSVDSRPSLNFLSVRNIILHHTTATNRPFPQNSLKSPKRTIPITRTERMALFP